MSGPPLPRQLPGQPLSLQLGVGRKSQMVRVGEGWWGHSGTLVILPRLGN